MPENLELSRGAKRCFALLQSYAARSGIAFPFQKTLAAKLEVDERTVRRYVRELVQSGQLKVTKRQHGSAIYEIQTGQNVRSGVRSDVRSGARFLNELKLSEGERRKPARREEKCITAAEMWPEQPRRSG